MSGPQVTYKAIEIFSTFDELEKIVEEAELFYSGCFSDDDRVYAGVLLVSEAVTNAIEHGNDLDASKKVAVEFRCSDHQAECWVEDQGAGFNRKDVANPLDDEHLMADGGRGIFLIERLADEVHYEKEGRRIGFILKR